MQPTPRQRGLLQRVAARQPFGRKDVNDPADGEWFDALVEELRHLQSQGWLHLSVETNSSTRQGHWGAVSARLTEAGQRVLSQPRRR